MPFFLATFPISQKYIMSPHLSQLIYITYSLQDEYPKKRSYFKTHEKKKATRLNTQNLTPAHTPINLPKIKPTQKGNEFIGGIYWKKIKKI